MNLWALTTDVFDRLEEQFAEFKTEADLTKDEFLLPTVINKLVTGGKATVKVYRNDDKWYGITYRDDLPEVRHALSALIASGDYDGIW